MSQDKEPLEAWVITDLVQRYEIEGDTQFIRVSAFNAALDELKATLRDMVGALEDAEDFGLKEVKEVLAKHADLIARLK